MLHVNARRLCKNFDKFTQLVDSMRHEFSAVGISEIWLNDISKGYVNITGYRFILSRVVSLVVGQVFIYVTLSILMLSDLCCSIEECVTTGSTAAAVVG